MKRAWFAARVDLVEGPGLRGCRLHRHAAALLALLPTATLLVLLNRAPNLEPFAPAAATVVQWIAVRTPKTGNELPSPSSREPLAQTLRSQHPPSRSADAGIQATLTEPPRSEPIASAPDFSRPATDTAAAASAPLRLDDRVLQRARRTARARCGAWRRPAVGKSSAHAVGARTTRAGHCAGRQTGFLGAQRRWQPAVDSRVAVHGSDRQMQVIGSQARTGRRPQRPPLRPIPLLRQLAG